MILERTRDRAAVPEELLDAAGMVLYSLDRAAGSAIPDVLELIVNQPDTAGVLTKVVSHTVSGYPNPAATLARTLDRLRRSVVFSLSAFAALAKVYAWQNLDGATLLVEDTSLDPRTPETLLQQPAWKDAPPDVRRRHALRLANSLGSPRPEVRARAADALRHYADQMPAVWPALVALLAGTDEKAVLLVLPLFRHLTPVTDEVTNELRELFREPNPTYAARAVVALWRLGRMPLVADDLREAVITATDDAWGWAVLRGVVDRVVQAHGLLHDLSDVFAAAPQEVAAKIHALLNPPELAEEAAISAHVPRPGDATRPQTVNWNGVYQCVGNEQEGGLLFIALMSAFGSAGFASQKIWLIKHQRAMSGTGLGEAMGIVERAMANLTATATPGDKRACVRDYFPAATAATAVPKGITDLLEHRVSWYRWAGLELLDAWGAPERVPELIEDRVWDRSALVRVRALRMNHG